MKEDDIGYLYDECSICNKRVYHNGPWFEPSCGGTFPDFGTITLCSKCGPNFMKDGLCLDVDKFEAWIEKMNKGAQ